MYHGPEDRGHDEHGGTRGSFPTTHWTVLESLKSADPAQRQVLRGALLQTYWKPVYCYLRRKGYGNEEAKDLTQGFFQEVILGRELFERADPAQGRWRTFLLTALDHYLASVHRRQTAQKRCPGPRVVALEWPKEAELPEVVDALACEETFDYTWITTLLDALLTEVRDECLHHGMELHWMLFRDRVLQPILADQKPPPLGDLCSTYGIEEATRASNMIFAVKKRFQAALRRQLRRSVACATEVGEEREELARFLARKRQYGP